MLIGFFKKPAECECYIVKYVDRIWLSENGDGQILRTVIVKVDTNSTASLNEIRMLLPYKKIIGLDDVCDTCFSSPAKNYFNSPEIYTTQDYKIIQEPSKPSQLKTFGVIRDDVGENVKVFCRGNLSYFDIADCSVIRYQFPCPVENGNSAEIRIKFQINSLFDRVTSGLTPNYSVDLPYFSADHSHEIQEIDPDKKLQIQVKPILGLEQSNFVGGFDIFLYFPPDFEEISGFEKCFKKKYDTHNIDGKDDSTNRYRCLWRLRDLLKKKGVPENKLVSIGEDIVASGVLAKRYDEKGVLDSLYKKTSTELEVLKEKIKKFTKKITQANYLSYIAIGIAALSILLFFLLKK